ncbi:hypothetical protein [Nocardioides alcanivorans]|uniref:hypothetical protein n=1 Tax=Nocardioides alcanivorans TaxID=2897352 RepID=UPI001F25CD03|nr:hypothetical protein [Nocardioides alcanivorans]
MNPVTGLALARIGLGALALIAPGLATRVFGLDTSQGQLTYMNRMFASREIALGAATLAAPADLRRQVVLAGVAVDAADAAAGALAGRAGVVTKRTGLMLALPALAAVATGIIGSRR